MFTLEHHMQDETFFKELLCIQSDIICFGHCNKNI